MPKGTDVTFEMLKKEDISAKVVIKQPDCMSRMVEMAWQDRTPFEAIKNEFNLSENQLKHAMRKLISPASYKMWRKRIQARSTKHLKSMGLKMTRFQGPW